MVLSDEEKREYQKEWREKNKEYLKEWREKNKETIKEKGKEYREKNKETIKEKGKEYRENNKEYRKEYEKQWREENKEYWKDYRKTPQCKKSSRIGRWKNRGLICEDYDSLYCHYLNAENCDECGILFGEKGDGTGTFKCMDHEHSSGAFRNFLCSKCNFKRG
tara:strand:- start:230 stop:718 length:489 start_codon:yes stop_codon:yes gene_type:complete